MTHRTVIALAALMFILPGAPPVSRADGLPDGFVVVRPADLAWQAVPSMPGIEAAFIVGDPNKPGPYIMRGKFSPGAMTRPHRHSADRYVVVISGTWYVGTSAVFDPGNTRALPAGSVMVHPAGGVHFDGAREEEVIVQISGIGPVTTEFVDPPP